MHNIDIMATSKDLNWPSAATLMVEGPVEGRRNVGLFGISTFASSVTPRSSTSTPVAVRAALERYSTWLFSESIDLSDHVALVDYGDALNPDSAGATERVADAMAAMAPDVALRLILGGDNAATWHGLKALSGGDYSNYGLVTLDAHLDMRDGTSNGSPVRQLLADGLDDRHVVQVGLADFSNSAVYAQRAHEAGVTVISRDLLHSEPIEEVALRAVGIAGAGGRHVYVDIDMDAADRSAVPGCPGAVPGGLSADEMRRFARAVAANHAVTAIDVTEVDVGRDSADERTVRLAALLVLEVLAGVRRRVQWP
ncbi:MAG: arginase family protein [Acidimicrobiales bacterium]